jgi:hypothetical protein
VLSARFARMRAPDVDDDTPASRTSSHATSHRASLSLLGRGTRPAGVRRRARGRVLVRVWVERRDSSDAAGPDAGPVRMGVCRCRDDG